jgi:hypothetical protein
MLEIIISFFLSSFVAHAADDLPEDSENKITVSMVGYKSLSQSGEGDAWHFDLPSVALEVNANEYIAAQTSLTILNQQYLINKEGADVLFERRRLMVPINISYKILSWLQISAGPYAGFAVNDLEVSRRGLNPSSRVPSSSIEDFLEFGFMSSLQFYIPVTNKIQIAVNAYHYVPYHEAQLKKSNSLFFTTGVKFGLGK